MARTAKPVRGTDAPIFIYLLRSPVDGEIRYVGQSLRPEERLRAHQGYARRDPKSYVNRWVRSLLDEGLAPVMEVVEQCPDKEAANAAERRWISDLRAQGARLTNLTDGGEGIYNPSPETRRKMSEASRGRRHPQESREKISASRRGRPLSEEHRRSLSEARRGKHLSSEHRESISRANKGRRPSDSAIEASRTYWTGRDFTEQHRERIREAALGRTPSEETCRKLSEALKGSPCSEEAKQKIGDANRGRRRPDDWQNPRAKRFVVTSPDGQEQEITNLLRFCKDHQLSHSAMYKVLCGQQKHHHGWKIHSLDEVSNG